MPNIYSDSSQMQHGTIVAMLYPLTKSRVMTGLGCQKALWLSVHKPEVALAPSDGQKLRFQIGNQIGERAHQYFPDGLLLEYDSDVNNAIAKTNEALTSGQYHTLFEATFSTGKVFCRVDVLTMQDDGTWQLIEVKSSKSVKDVYVEDLALQAYVLRYQGLEVTSFGLMLINDDCRFPDLHNLFKIEDVSKKVEARLLDMEQTIADLQQVLAQADEPDELIGSHCKNPYPCTFKNYCWEPLGKTIFHIPNFRGKQKTEILERNIVRLDEIPDDIPLTALAKNNVELLLEEQVHIDHAAIENELSSLQYPLYFFDFETLAPAVPRFDAMKPYEQFPFQFSCHVIDNKDSAAVRHYEYLHDDETDPREALSLTMLDTLKRSGTIIAYHASFEKSVIKALAATLPQYSRELNNLLNRFWDQLDVFKKHYKHHGFMGSNSLKSVLPVIAPELSYKTLGVQNGEEAQFAWQYMLDSEDVKEKASLRKALLAYCELDTFAMVAIHKHLEQL